MEKRIAVLTRHPFDRLIIEFRRWKASPTSKKWGRSKRSSLRNQINHNDRNSSQNYLARKVYLESSSIKNQSSYISKQRKIGVLKMTNAGTRIRKRRSFARHRNIFRGRAGRGRGQQFRLKRMKMRTKIKFRRMINFRINFMIDVSGNF